LLEVLKPPKEERPMGFAALAPLDRFLMRNRIAIVVVTLLVVGLASPLLLTLPFDFDPNHMRSPEVASVATYLELRKDPQAGANAIDVVLQTLSAANATARRLARLPEVAQARTLSNFVPSGQDAKLKLIRDAGATIGPSLNPDGLEPAPSDQETIESLT